MDTLYAFRNRVHRCPSRIALPDQLSAPSRRMCADHDESAAQPHSDPGESGAVSHSDLLWRLEYEKSRWWS
jgi:hypothetical protein